MNKSQNQNVFLDYFTTKKIHLWALLFFFFLLIEMTDFATLSYTSINKWNPDTFIYLKPEIGTPFGRSLPLQAIIGSTPGDLYDSVLPAHPADQIVFSTSSTCNLPGRECVLFPMKNFSPSDVVMKGLGLRSLTQAGFPRILSGSRAARHVYKVLYVNTEVERNFPFSIGWNTLQLRPFSRSCSNFQIVLLTINGRGSWKLHTDVCCK